MYCTCNGKIFNSWNKVRQEALFVEFVIILIILFCILNIFILYGELPQNIIPYVSIECTWEKYIIYNVSNDKMDLSDRIAK
jgi:hypothetical protein